MTRSQKSPTIGGIDREQLWYIPDPHLRTNGAAEDAIAIAEWINTGADPKEAPNEQQLFIAMHTCAYRAVRPGGRKRITGKERSQWARRWTTIREYLVEANLGLVYSMISRFSSRNVDEDALLSDAMLGLSRAVDRFSPWKGYRFSTYACNVIARALMRRGKRESQHRQTFPVQFDVSMEQPEPEADIESELYVERLQYVMDQNLGFLTELESRIISRRFPADDEPRQTFHEIADTVGLSKERVRQIQNIALDKLRQALQEDPVLQ